MLSIKRNKIHVISIIFLIIIFSFRLFFIDSDISAPWGVLNYQPIDEGLYANLALNKMNFGSINPNIQIDVDVEYLMQPHVLTNICGNIIVYLGLRVFGDNFFGFRIGSVLTSFLIVVLFYFSLNNIYNAISKEKGKRKIPFFLVPVLSIYFGFNFVFYNASRLTEPTLFRLLFLELIIFIFTLPKVKNSIKAFLMAFFAIVSIFMVYVTNVFIMLAFALLLLYWILKKEYKTFVEYLKYSIPGIICGYAISYVYYARYWDTSPIKNLLACITSFGSSAGYDIEAANRFQNLSSFTSANIFLYNPVFIIAIVWGGYFLIKKKKEKKNEAVILSYFLVGALLLQTLFSEDYIVRKALVLMPALLIIVFFAAYNYFLYHEEISLKVSCVLNGISISWVFYNIIYRLFLIENGTNLDFSKKDRYILYLMFVGVVFVFILGSIVKKQRYLILVLLLVVSFSANTLYIIKYNWMNQTYCDKTAMQQLGEIVGDEYVLGEYINGYTLYNDIKPVLNTQDKLLEYMLDNHSLYYFDYSNYHTYNLSKEFLNYYVEPVKSFPRAFKTFGINREMTLYKWRK